jgi:hypothetical protein
VKKASCRTEPIKLGFQSMNRLYPVLVFLVTCLTLAANASAQTAFVACANKKTDKLVFRARCRSSETKISTRTELRGPAGTNGTNGTNGADGSSGANGSLRIYGDGSAGALSISTSTTFDDQHVKQWTDCYIDAGATVTVPSGTVLRCSGTFTNNGTITVSPSLATQYGSLQNSATTYPAIRLAGISGVGWGRTQASNGQAGDTSSILAGGGGGFSMTAAMARTILHPGPIGGGAGGSGLGAFGAAGGGSLTILAGGALVNNGTIQANGDDASSTGGGGGAGGIIILASKTSFSQSGTISAEGGNGATFSVSRGPGGGGGGGIVHILAPTITDAGSRSVAAGVAGAAGGAGSVTATIRSGGGSGGSCAGSGGAGGSVLTDNSTGTASAGTAGLSLSTESDPTSLL